MNIFLSNTNKYIIIGIFIKYLKNVTAKDKTF